MSADVRKALVAKRMAWAYDGVTRWTSEDDKAVDAAYDTCLVCNGEGRRHLDGRDAPTGHRTCLACQGQGLREGWRNDWFKDIERAEKERAIAQAALQAPGATPQQPNGEQQ